MTNVELTNPSVKECKEFLIKERIGALREKTNFGTHLTEDETSELGDLKKQLTNYNINNIVNSELKGKLETLDVYDEIKDIAEGADHEGKVICQGIVDKMKERTSVIVEQENVGVSLNSFYI